MSACKLLFAEVRYRKLNFLLSLLAVTAAAALFVAGPSLVDGYGRETDRRLAELEDQTRRLMRDIGFNLLIVHRDTNMSDFWAEDYAKEDMPEEYVVRLAESPELEHIRHLVATLQQKIKWRQRSVLLSGWLRETTQTHFGKKKPMGYNIPAGTVYLGYELAKSEDLKEGDRIEVLGKTFNVGRTVEERGSKEDITIAMSLADAQEVLDKPGRINHILALGCQCDEERLPTIRRELEAALPETKITEHKSIAQARAEQRDAVAAQRGEVQATMEGLFNVLTPLVVLACGVWVGLLTLANVRERRGEIGLLRALGKGSTYIAGLFLTKAVFLGLLGGALGYLAGAAAAGWIGSSQLSLSPADFAPGYDMLGVSLVGAALICLLASYLPTLRAIGQDPAVVLRDA